jgi:membrane-associated phospholipid phosphatase
MAVAMVVAMPVGTSVGSRDAAAQLTLEPRGPAFWAGSAAAVAAAAAADGWMQRQSRLHRSHTLDRLAEAGDVLGSGRYLIPAMVATYLGARIASDRGERLADGVLRAAVAYAAGNVLVSVLKPAIGRHRPEGIDEPGRFDPFSTRGEWHSFPSAHTMHLATITAVVADASGSRWASGGAYALVGLVGWSRVYRDQHWTSDVTATTAMAIAVGLTASRWLERRRR